jgi:hypothetical protein
MNCSRRVRAAAVDMVTPTNTMNPFPRWDGIPKKLPVIEDSLSGVSKAKAHSADIRVVGTVAARFYTDKEAQAKALLDAGASLVISDMRDLSVALDWLNADMDPIVMPTFRGKVYTPYPNLNVPVLRPEIK